MNTNKQQNLLGPFAHLSDIELRDRLSHATQHNEGPDHPDSHVLSALEQERRLRGANGAMHMADAFLQIANARRVLDSNQLLTFLTPSVLNAVAWCDWDYAASSVSIELAIALKHIQNAADNGLPYPPIQLLGKAIFREAWESAWLLCSAEVGALPHGIETCRLALTSEQVAYVKCFGEGEYDYLLTCANDEAFKEALGRRENAFLKMILERRHATDTKSTTVGNIAEIFQGIDSELVEVISRLERLESHLAFIEDSRRVTHSAPNTLC
jgi:hypothetical protein